MGGDSPQRRCHLFTLNRSIGNISVSHFPAPLTFLISQRTYIIPEELVIGLHIPHSNTIACATGKTKKKKGKKRTISYLQIFNRVIKSQTEQTHLSSGRKSSRRNFNFEKPQCKIHIPHMILLYNLTVIFGIIEGKLLFFVFISPIRFNSRIQSERQSKKLPYQTLFGSA